MRYIVKDRSTGNTVAMDEMPYSEIREIVRDMSGDPGRKPEILIQGHSLIAVLYMDKLLDLDDRDIR